MPEEPTDAAPSTAPEPSAPAAARAGRPGGASRLDPAPSTGGGGEGTLGADLRDAVRPRTLLLVLGVLVIQLGFIASYVGAFHAPSPHGVSYTLVGPTQVTRPLAAQLRARAGSAVHVRTTTDEATARARLRAGSTAGALVVDTSGTTDRLLVASGGGAALATAVETLTDQVEAAQHRTSTTSDVVPLQRGDARGLSGFYLVIGWLVGGYLAASLLEIAKGARRTTGRRTAVRLAVLVPYGVLSGLGGALVVDQLFGALTGHFLALWALGALLAYAAAAVTTAFQALLGVLGIGLTVIVFVVIGNPSAGGAYAWQLLPGFWRAVGPWLPNGAGTDAVRRVVYFAAHDVAGDVLVVAAWALAGVLVALAAATLRGRRHPGAR